MTIENKIHCCPICGQIFQVSYDKPNEVKILDKVTEVGATLEYGFQGHYVVKEVIKGRDAILRKVFGSTFYKFKCPNPKCGYVSKIFY